LIDPLAVVDALHDAGLARLADVVPAQLEQVLQTSPHGDWPKWRAALQSLPMLGAGRLSIAEGAISIRPDHSLAPTSLRSLQESLMVLHPWRKGPYRVADALVDTEWRSDWKWDRVRPHLDDLTGRVVLDVGCGNGYHAWRAAMDGARLVVGIDPTALFLAQFLAIKQLLAPLSAALAARVHLQPIGIESLPGDLRGFDTVFSMGVLYHRRSPLDHLFELRGALRRGGQLVLETLVIDGGGQEVLVPPGRYAKMRNVWFIPTTTLLEDWLRRVGFNAVRTVDVTQTGLDEQRSTSWMTFESLADFLDPVDNNLTIEHHPAPRRAIIVAEAG
jgi:tRNA (mo5U34)-methyltransferase